jgi:hypothetical protein
MIVNVSLNRLLAGMALGSFRVHTADEPQIARLPIYAIAPSGQGAIGG